MVELQEARPPWLQRGAQWLVKRLAPREGWLSILLVAVIVVGVANAVVETAWVATIDHVWLNSVVAALLATALAKRLASTRWSWAILVVSGLLVTTLRVGELLPPLTTWRDGSWDTALMTRVGLFAERLQGWVVQLWVGGSSGETLPFLLGVGMAIWLLSALLAWQTYRTRQPLPALTLICFGVALVGYFSASPLHWLLQVLMAAIALAALMRFVTLQMVWERDGVDYPDHVLYDFAIAVAVFAILFPLMGYVTPRLAIPAVSRAFANSQGVLAVEEVLERAFGGVDVQAAGGRGGAGGAVGVMPRQHLLSGSPELLQSVVMTATVQGITERATHWRALSYDNYTGRGWEISAENQTNQPANRPISHPDIVATTTLSQTVYWLQDNRSTRYTLGRPEQLDQPTRLQWHGRSDLVRVRGDGRVYQVQSLVSVATAEALSQVESADIPSAILGRYTQLPDTVPQRVLDLADSVTANAATSYAKAKALETFLRQYEYTLDVDVPPANQDAVDFFLFEQQAGYCDYYATAMTVMARHIGLPARMAIGFAAAPTIDGSQELRGIDAHSWTEIYFGEYGWIEFEPTGGFALSAQSADLDQPLPTEPPPPIPERTVPFMQIMRWVAASLALIAVVAFYVWRSLRPPPLPDTATRYAQLQRHAAQLAIPLAESQTPLEFLGQFEEYITGIGALAWIKQRPRLARRLVKLQQVASTLTNDFIRVQYDELPPTATISNRQWQQTRRLLWLLRLVRRQD